METFFLNGIANAVKIGFLSGFFVYERCILEFFPDFGLSKKQVWQSFISAAF